ncbi:hypothetical protein A1353_00220 [Methylomonas methanica]|uniref:Type I restriction modification DNA specificity domain-containing protein n=1 Tax=Methylomonas methanica TaxID=421 RepID=A0A177MHL9_METMH|nr:restriction endonuclease subunit S [Methylomonas methanica]OAI05298.1 hypothetical protein A1353_00220 [Methylomonas methanica]
MSQWEKIQLGDICQKANRLEAPVMGQPYRQLGVRLWGEGAYERETIDGGDTKYAFLNKIEADDLVVNKIWARNGSIAVANPNQAGTYVSAEFPTYQLDVTLIEPRWMRLITKWRGFWSACDEKAQGTSGKNRIKPEQFLSIQIPLPSLTEQQTIVACMDQLADKVRQVNEHLDAAETDAGNLLAVQFREAIKNAPSRKMSEVAPLVRREQTIELEGNYPELGIRSFGKGTFHKPPLSGSEVGTKRLFRIEPGDLMFSNVFAWEGAIAIAKPEDSGRFGSHRFITCKANREIATAEFLRYFFLTETGLEMVGKASPGGAGRNRTLGLEKLMALEVPIPSLAIQREFNLLQNKIAELKAKHAKIREANQALIPATLERVFQ